MARDVVTDLSAVTSWKTGAYFSFGLVHLFKGVSTPHRLFCAKFYSFVKICLFSVVF